MSAPPTVLIWAVAGCAVFPLVLLLLSRGPLKISRQGPRFAIAWSIVVLGWAIAVAGLVGRDATLLDCAAGLMLFAAAISLSFMLWSVLCWGVTLNMLIHIADERRVASTREWEVGYTGGAGLARLVTDRAGILYRFGLARPAPGAGGIAVTVTGRRFGALTLAAAQILAIRS